MSRKFRTFGVGDPEIIHPPSIPISDFDLIFLLKKAFTCGSGSCCLKGIQ
jgi:hypothetical protein